jgi:hypothetical protein
MDYRLVKQFSNNSIDSFFNFFYKMVDFLKVFVDLLWAFADIWYQFLMIFLNAWLYLYYFSLFIVDKLTLSGVFAHRAHTRHQLPGANVILGRPSPMFGRVAVPSPAKPVAAVAKAAVAVTQTVTPRAKAAGARKSITKEALKGIVDIFRRIFNAIAKKIMRIVEFLSFRMRPTREESPSDKKSIIDDYMREYTKKKK